MSIENGITPDGTTINNVVANGLFQQTAGPTNPFTFQETDSPAGPFTIRPIAQVNITVNLANATKGVYSVGTNSNVTADYTTGTTVQPGRPVSVPQNFVAGFAYDPASANLVGNGDGSLQFYGWETFDTKANVVEHEFFARGALGLGLQPQSGDPQSLSQILSEPTSSGPMLLSFSYDITPGFDPADMTVSLGGIAITDIAVTATTPTTFQTIINNSALESLTNATLTFHATDTGTIGVSLVNLGRISLTAVPEPASASLLSLAATALLTRRRRQRN